MMLLDVSSNDFLQKCDFDHFDLILFKHLSHKISFSNFVHILLDHITFFDIIGIFGRIQPFDYICILQL